MARTVAQRRVYGKRKNNAPRAVFDQNSPARETSKATDATFEAIQSQLAGVTINDRSLSPSREVEIQEHAVEHKPEEQDGKGAESQNTDESPSHVSESQNTSVSADTSTEQFSKERSDETQNHQIIEVPNQSSQRSKGKASKESPPTTKERAIKKKSVVRRSSGFVHDPNLNTYVAPILKEALSPIASQSIQRFGAWASKSAKMFHVEKLAEGSYGEVYKLHLREESARPMVSKSKLAKLRMYGDGVFKVVPLNAPRGPGSKKFTSVEEIVSEARMLKYLDPIPGFARFREIHVVQGRFPEPFQEAWDYYKETKDDCMNPNPASKKSYPDTQLWAIVEMDDAGCELEKFSWSSIFQIYDIFWGVAMALARAEEYAMFEVSCYETLKYSSIFSYAHSAS